ncbi:MAG: hypothetical protein PHS83_05810, partial [Clostridia bacterium]|nr:hypothetical protein [Clostridia bacterium]
TNKCKEVQVRMHQDLECIFDWLEFTIHSLNEEEVILQVLKLNLADFIELPKGRYGYKKQLALGHISVLFNSELPKELVLKRKFHSK